MVENFMDGFTIYKKSVFTFKYTINKNNITSEGMFDLERVPNLRIMDNGFLKRLRLKTSKTQRECARLTGIPLRTWIGWESYHKLLPFSKLVVLSKQVGVSKKMLYALIKGAVFSYGKHHGKIKQALPLIPHKFILPKYLIPEKNGRVYLVSDAPANIKKYILGAYPFDKCLFKKRGLIVINSYLLAIFLKTFYIYKKESLLNFPLSSETHKLIKSGADLRKSVIIPLLLSDGGEKPDLRLFISGAGKEIHNLWADAFYYRYGLLPSSFVIPYKNIFITTHRLDENILADIKKLCLNSKKSPYKQSKNNYLKSSQPSILPLLSSCCLEQQMAIRIWATTEGSIGIALDRRSGLVIPSLKIACANPNLINELKILSKLNGINFGIVKRSNTWSGLSALGSYSIKSTANFLKIGGFIKGVKIAKSRSRYFGDFDKQDTLLGILEFVIRQRRGKETRITNKETAYKKIANIIKNKEFQCYDDYNVIFDEQTFDNWSFRRKK